MEFLCENKYIVFPASHHAAKKRVRFYIEDKLIYDLLIPLDEESPEYEFPLNVERFMGKKLRLEWDDKQDHPLHFSDARDDWYDGLYRPCAHFTARRGWLNDPNGLIKVDNTYFMFYQHNPVDCEWENMHWGCAVSEDLVHWHEKEIALYPDEYGTMFSGSAVLDTQNVTGLKENDHDVILLFYTCAGSTSETSANKPFTQNLAYSTDGGNTFVKYHGNPLIEQIVPGNRDPKVIWYEPAGCYIMVLYLDNHEFALFTSQNLLDWTQQQRIVLSEDAECPDFYPLPVDNGAVQWVFSAASDRYYVGSFDGKRFTPETPLKRLNYGDASYAAQSWSGTGDRRIRTAFASVVIPGMPFGSLMNLPQEMSLKTVHGELCLCAQPVQEISRLYGAKHVWESIAIDRDHPFSQCFESRCCDITIVAKAGASFTFDLFGLPIDYDAQSETLNAQGCAAPVKGCGGIITLRILSDSIYAEIYAEDGSVFMGMKNVQHLHSKQMTISSDALIIEKLIIVEMKKFWER